jgi:hypothetical protein
MELDMTILENDLYIDSHCHHYYYHDLNNSKVDIQILDMDHIMFVDLENLEYDRKEIALLAEYYSPASFWTTELKNYPDDIYTCMHNNKNIGAIIRTPILTWTGQIYLSDTFSFYDKLAKIIPDKLHSSYVRLLLKKNSFQVNIFVNMEQQLCKFNLPIQNSNLYNPYEFIIKKMDILKIDNNTIRKMCDYDLTTEFSEKQYITKYDINVMLKAIFHLLIRL